MNRTLNEPDPPFDIRPSCPKSSDDGHSEMFRRACLEVNFVMTMHQARHVCAYWILSVDPNAWDEAAALLGDNELTVRKYYAWMNKRRASQAGRAKLQQARKGVRKHRPGAFDNAA